MWHPGGFLRSLRNSSPAARSLPLYAAYHRLPGGTPRPKGSWLLGFDGLSAAIQCSAHSGKPPGRLDTFHLSDGAASSSIGA